MSEENKYTFENEEYRRTYWHTCSHVLAQAVKRLHPEVKLAIGPSIENGFYYDLDAPFAFTQDDLAGAVAKVAKIGYKLIEFAGFFGHSAQEVTAMLEETACAFPAPTPPSTT